MIAAGLSEHKGFCGLPELEKMQAVMPDYRIKVYTKEKYGGLLYDGNINSILVYISIFLFPYSWWRNVHAHHSSLPL